MSDQAGSAQPDIDMSQPTEEEIQAAQQAETEMMAESPAVLKAQVQHLQNRVLQLNILLTRAQRDLNAARAPKAAAR